jgi:DNA modification methylase
MELNKIFLGDALDLIKNIPSETIDLILTDPPYGLNKDIAYDESLELFYKILPELYRVLKNDRFFITFFSTKYLPKLFENNPFTYFWQIILYSPGAAVQSPIGFTKYMSCFVFKKGSPKIKKRKKDIFIDTPTKMVEPDEGFIDHPTPKPKTFLAEIIEMFSEEGDIVLDPFIGSGSTALACIMTNRNYIGFEIEEKYVKLALERIEKFKKRGLHKKLLT